MGGQIPGGDADGVDLPGGKDLREHHHVGGLQLPHKVVKQGPGAGVGVGLEGADHPAAIQGPGHLQQGVELSGVVGVVVVDPGPVHLPLVLKPPARAGECLQPPAHRLPGYAQDIGGRGGGQGVVHVVPPRHVQRQVGVERAVHHDIELPPALSPGEVLRPAVRPLRKAEGEQGQARQGVHGVFVVCVGHHPALRRRQLGEAAEGGLDVLQVLEEVQMVLLNVQNHRHGGEEAEEAVAVLAGLQNDGLSAAHPVAAVEHGQGAADHHRGVRLGGHEDVGGHGGGGGLAVGAGDAQGVLILPHDGPPGLRPLKDRDPQGPGGGDLRVVVVDGGGAHHELRAVDVAGLVAHVDGNAQRAQPGHGGAVGLVTALDQEAHAVEHLRQRAHGHAADARQMDPAARGDVGGDFGVNMGHGTGSFPNGKKFAGICLFCKNVLYYKKPRCARSISTHTMPVFGGK